MAQGTVRWRRREGSRAANGCMPTRRDGRRTARAAEWPGRQCGASERVACQRCTNGCPPLQTDG
eukprot:2613056-Prymnesium_polylepis.1